MSEQPYQLPLPGETSRPLTAGWLYLALASLVGSGLVVILIVLSRTPIIHDMIPWVGSFRPALVIHVELSVLVWFLAIAGIFAGLGLSEKHPQWGKLSLGLAWAGALLITCSPFMAAGEAYINNYVPTLDNPPFFWGLGIFGAGVALMTLHGLYHTATPNYFNQREKALLFGIRSALLILLASIALLLWTLQILPADAEGKERYEYLRSEERRVGEG